MIEIEKTYLAKYLPRDLENYEAKEIIDIYIPKSDPHPCLRIRKNGNEFEITKKNPVKKEDASIQKEQTINLTKEEFQSLEKIDGKRLKKIRYQYKLPNGIAEFDVFQEDLSGLVLIDIEFEAEDTKNDFSMPDFCLADVTQEKFVAGGMLCGKKYEDIENDLEKFSYKKL
ncbi:MAG: hypothetical protein PF549_02860 [Patescibacteria group bacterium]|jgi:adenylate cyclase|nr:hypothetical protein [Patescibacteria group bacterium]